MNASLDLRRRLTRNMSWQSGSQIVGLLLGLATTRLLTWKLGKVGWGRFSFLFGFIVLFQAFSDLGVSTLLIRDLAKTPERTRELVRHVLGLKVLIATGAMVAAWITAAFTPLDPKQRWAIDVFALILPIQAMTLPAAILQAQLRFARTSVIEILTRVSGFVLMVGAVALGYHLMGVTLALVGGELVGLAAVLFATRGLASAVPTFDSPRWRMLLAASLPLGAAAILVAIVNRFDFQMLQWMLPASIRDVEIGYYGAAYRVPQLVERLPLLVMATIFPIMSQLSVASPIRLQQLYHQTLRNFALIAAPMVAIVTWQAPMMLRLLCGPGYEPAVPMLRLLVWSSAFVYVAVVAGNLLIAIGHQGASLRAWVIAAPINIGLNLMLIPRYGARGAAASTSVSFLIVLLIVLVLAERRLKDTIIGQTPVSIVPAGEPSRVR